MSLSLTTLLIVAILFGIGYYTYTILNRNEKGLYGVHMVALAAYHLLFTLYFYYYSNTNISDATMYFRRGVESEFYWGIGTSFILMVVKTFNTIFLNSLSKLDVFLIFSSFGFIGVLLLVDLMRTIVPTYLSKYWVLSFIPGMHFWTSSIGKDSLVFLGICLAMWSMIALRKRYIGYIIGFTFLVIIRPHIALVLMAAHGIAVMMDHKNSMRKRLFGTIVYLSLFLIMYNYVLEYIGLTSGNQLFDYVEYRQTLNQSGGSSIQLDQYSLLFAIFSFWFRPLFENVFNLLELIVSIENIILMLIWGTIFFRYRKSLKIGFTKYSLFRVSIIFLAIGTFILASTTSNLGLAIRQKIMLYPAVLVLAMICVRVFNARRQSIYDNRDQFL